MTLEYRLAFQGNLQAFMRREVEAISTAMDQAVGESARAIQLAARAEVNAHFGRSARVRGGNRRVANAIRMHQYDDGPFRSAAIVYSKFGRRGPEGFVDYLAPAVFGATITPKRGKFLYIPLERGRAARRRRQAVALQKNLRFVQLSGGRVLIVRDSRTRSTPIGLLVPRVVIRPKLNFTQIVDRETEALPRRLAELMEAEARDR